MDMRKEWEKWNIHRASKMEWQPAMDLAWRTFLRYEAGDYTNEGIRSFQEFVSDGRLEQLFLRGSYHLYVATHDGEIVGMITKRDVRHISLLFVDSDYHKMGIGKALITYLAAELRKDDITGMTVNAAPYGIGFYHKVGFKDVGQEEEAEGIRYTPMVYTR